MTEAAEPAPNVAKPPLAPPARDRLHFADRIFLAIDNPVLRRELLSALRGNKAFILQFLYLLGLGAVICWAWPREAISTDNALTRKLFRTFGQGQIVLLSMLAPAFSASAMTIEKERGCLDLLLTSPIRPGTILLGKYLSSVLYLLLLVLSTAPLVSIVMSLPGLGPMDVAGLYVLLGSVALCFGMIGLTCSVFFHRSQSSLSITYMIVLPLALMLLVCALSFDGFFILDSAVWPSGMMLLAAFVMYRSCHARLRRPFDPVFKAAEEEDITTQTGLVLVSDRFPDNLLAPQRNGDLLPDGVNPVYQKEIRSEIFGRGTLFVRVIIQISMFLSVIFLTALFMRQEHILVDYLIIFTMLVAPAFACNSITQERERGTLDLLLTTLLRPSQIIGGKFLACLRLSIFLTALVGLTLVFYLLVGNDEGSRRLIYFGVYLAIILATIVFEISLAMFFSVIFRGAVQSMIATYSALLLLFAAPVAAKELLLSFTKVARGQMSGVLFASPFEAAYSVSMKALGSTQLIEQKVLLWPWFLIFYATLSAALMFYVHTSFLRKSLEHTRGG
jgi:ABC-type transport system involved in multi-copper enzyme maturation permease subunit